MKPNSDSKIEFPKILHLVLRIILSVESTMSAMAVNVIHLNLLIGEHTGISHLLKRTLNLGITLIAP